MKPLIKLFIVLLFLSCKEEGRGVLIPKRFMFPTQYIGKGLLCVYLQDQHRPSYRAFTQIILEQGKKFLVTANYFNGFIEDSCKTDLSGKIVELYNHTLLPMDSLLKADIIQSQVTGQVLKSTYIYKIAHSKVEVREKEQYIQDTVIDENGNKLKCFETKTISNLEWFKKEERVASEITVTYTYYAEKKGKYLIKIYTKNNSSWLFQMGIFKDTMYSKSPNLR